MSRLRALPILTFAWLLSACGHATVTGVSSEPMTLTFEPATQRQVGTRTADGNLRCEVDLTILAHGTSDHRVTLQSIAAMFTIAGVSNSPAMIAPTTWFGVSSLLRDQTAVTRRQPTAPSPFTFTATLTYADQFGAMKTTVATTVCTD